MSIPGTDVAVILAGFSVPAETPARPFAWRIQDVGAPEFQLEVTGLDSLLERARAPATAS